MDHIFYKQQIERLKNQWPNAYSEERMIIFYNALRNVFPTDFSNAVSYCLANSRGAPLLGEISEAVFKMQEHRKAQERYDDSDRQRKEFHRDLAGLALINTTSDPDFVLKCLKAESDYDNKKITKKELDNICDALDKEAEILTKKKRTYENPDNWKDLVAEATRIVIEQEKQKRKGEDFSFLK